MNERYVVTGGAGFIGSQVVRTLVSRGADRVVVIDNLLTGKAENLHDVRGNVEFHQVDIRDYNAMLPVMRGCGYAVHLAAIPSVPLSIEDLMPCHDVNLNGTLNVYRASKDAGVKRVVFAASSAAYGDTDVLPNVESAAPRPKSPYAAQKVLGELYASVFSNCYGLETVSLRFFNVYGPRQDPSSAYSGVLSIFMRCILEDKAPAIHGDGEQTRDFTYVEDVAELVIKALHREGVSGRLFNAGNGVRFTLNEVWATLKRITGCRLDPSYGPARAGDVRHSQADITEAVRWLGHAPEFTLEEGLRRTFEWYSRDTSERASLSLSSR